MPPNDASWQLHVASEAEMDCFGTQLSEVVTAGLVVALVGELGAGKTRLVRAVATALGADETLVNSPTFVLVQHYEATLPIFHFDTYRLRDADDFSDLGPEETFAAGGICFVEWADRVEDALPDDHLRIEIDATGPTSRHITLTATGPQALAVVKRLRPASSSGMNPTGGKGAT